MRINEIIVKNEAKKLYLNGVSIDDIKENINSLFSGNYTRKDIIVWREVDEWERELAQNEQIKKERSLVSAKLPEFEVVQKTQYEKLLEYQREIDDEIQRLKDEGKALNARLITAGVEVSKQILKVVGTQILGTGKNEITNILINFDNSEKKKSEIIEVEQIASNE